MRNLRRSHRPSALAAVLAAAILPVLAACGTNASGSDSGAPGTLRVGQLGSAKVTEALLQASGEDKGITYGIEWSLFPGGGPAFLEAVPSGSVDLAQMADTPPIFGQVAGTPTKVVGVQTSVADGKSTVEIFAAKDSGITSVADLKGKKVALTQGTILQYTVLKALEKVGLSYSDITPVNLPPTDGLTAFQSGDVDAVAALGPQLAQLTLAGTPVIGDGVGITSGYQFSVATDAAIADPQKLADITDFLQRVGRAQAWADAHESEWIPKYAAVLGAPEAIAKVLVEREAYAWVPIDSAVITNQQAQADAYTSLGLVKTTLDVSQEFDDRLDAALTGK